MSIRDIAVAAGVSPSLVIHHYGSKQGFKDAVDNCVNDLATIVFRDQIRATLGFDPLMGEGLRRWSPVAMEIYGSGMFISPLPDQPRTRPAGR